MTEQMDRQAQAAELKRQLEALAGQEIDATPEELVFSFWWPVSATSYDLDTDRSEVLWTNAIIPPRRCVDSRLLDVSAANRTGADGQCVFLLRDFLCRGGDGLQLYAPVNVVATARASTPCFLTLTYDLTTLGENTDVRFTAFTWNPDGTAAPDIPFDWRCRVVAEVVLH
jgi:hypothetical protein